MVAFVVYFWIAFCSRLCMGYVGAIRNFRKYRTISCGLKQQRSIHPVLCWAVGTAALSLFVDSELTGGINVRKKVYAAVLLGWNSKSVSEKLRFKTIRYRSLYWLIWVHCTFFILLGILEPSFNRLNWMILD